LSRSNILDRLSGHFVRRWAFYRVTRDHVRTWAPRLYLWKHRPDHTRTNGKTLYVAMPLRRSTNWAKTRFTCEKRRSEKGTGTEAGYRAESQRNFCIPLLYTRASKLSRIQSN